MTPAAGAVPQWRADDTEPVLCCVDHVAGEPVYRLDPFGVVRCPTCGLVFVSPRLRPRALQRLYDGPEYHEGVYGDAGSTAMALQDRWTAGRLDLAAAQVHRPVAGARLLEIGAGHGLFLDAARRRGFSVEGVELSVTAAAHARDVLGLTVHATQVEDAPLDPGFDVVCFWDTLEHVPDPVRFWSAVRGLLAPDGVALFSTPYYSSLPARLLRQRWWTLKPAEHIWQFTPRTHRTVAAAADMTLVRTICNPLRRANFARLDSLVGVARPARAAQQPR